MRTDQEKDRQAFEQAAAGEWREVLSDPCTEDWGEQWFLDGLVGTVRNGPAGMTLTSGTEIKNDAHHMVLWTKRSFTGDVRIEYDYTRLDSSERGVNIIYIEATGSGEEPYVKDITAWNELRRVPASAVGPLWRLMQIQGQLAEPRDDGRQRLLPGRARQLDERRFLGEEQPTREAVAWSAPRRRALRQRHHCTERSAARPSRVGVLLPHDQSRSPTDHRKVASV